MKKCRYFLGGMLVFLCLLCSCSGGYETGKSALQEETSEKEREAASDEEIASDTETPIKEENPDETQDETQDEEEIPPAPIFLYCKVVSQKEIVFAFSQSVTMKGLSINTEQGQEIAIAAEHEKLGKGKTITVSLAENLQSGQVLIADFIAEDDYNNNVDRKIFFSSTATSAPALQINELRTENTNPKVEFIEFKMLSSGNLGALRVYAASNDKASLIYTFGSVEVKEGEYVVLHLRTIDKELPKDELGMNLDESGGTDSCPTARDFWISSNEVLRKTDAVYVMDGDWVLDAVMFADNSNAWSGKDYFVKTAELLFSKHAWKSLTGDIAGVVDTVNSSGTTATRTICRDETVENDHTAANWYVTITSGATPGKANNPNRL